MGGARVRRTSTANTSDGVKLSVEVKNSRIDVTLPGTSFQAIYFRPLDGSGILRHKKIVMDRQQRGHHPPRV